MEAGAPSTYNPRLSPHQQGSAVRGHQREGSGCQDTRSVARYGATVARRMVRMSVHRPDVSHRGMRRRGLSRGARTLRIRLLPLAVTVAVAAACGGDGTPASPSMPPVVARSTAPPPPAIFPDAVLVGAGDVAKCGVPE